MTNESGDGAGAASAEKDGVAPPPSGRRRFVGLGIGALLLPLGVIALGSAPALLGFEDPAMRAIEACPMANEALGVPFSRSFFGLSCGSAETGDSVGDASWTFPVAGSRASGSLSVVAQQHGGPWTMLQESLEVGDRTIDVLACVESAGPIGVRAASYDATVTATIGAPGVAPGDPCRVAISAAPEGTYPCHVQITCGDRTLYGAGMTGYTPCGLDASGAMTIHDGSPTPTGGDPTLDLHVATGEAILTDQVIGGAWAVSMHLDVAR